MSQRDSSLPPEQPKAALSRRAFLKGSGAMAATTGALEAAQEVALQEAGLEAKAGTFQVALKVNGSEQKVNVEPRTTLLAALRDRCQPPLTGAKLVCDRGQCGACTVMVDGQPAYSCLQLACDMEGHEITTVEGLAGDAELSPVQQAFAECDASMCGFCTPGFVVSVSSKLDRDPDASLEEVRSACSGNLCRCGTYPHIWNAIERAKELSSQGGAK